jgi:UDP:flavonoid glycosyltransferase YjiC (YdhE family)
VSKVIFFCIPAHGHVNAQLALAEALVKNGEKVIYYCAPAFGDKILKTGAEFRPFSTPSDDAVERLGQTIGKNPVKIARMIVDVSNEVFDALDAEVKKEKPDYIISDIITYYGMAAAEVNNIPLVTFVPVFCIDVKMWLSLTPAFLTMMLIQVLSVPADILALISGLSRLKKHFKRKPVGLLNPFSRYSGLNIASISRQFQYKDRIFPEDKFVFAGPMLFFGREEADFPVEKLAGKKVIYISLGTVYNKRPEFFFECFKAFGGSEYTVIMSMPISSQVSGSRSHVKSGMQNGQLETRNPKLKTELTTPDTRNPIPDNFIVKNYIPQLQVLPHTDVFITHGGMNSVQESLYFGVPMVIVPQATDQYMNGHRAAQLGAGIFMNKETPSARELLAAVGKIFTNPSYREKAKQAGEESRKAGGVEAAVRAVEKFKIKNNIS